MANAYIKDIRFTYAVGYSAYVESSHYIPGYDQGAIKIDFFKDDYEDYAVDSISVNLYANGRYMRHITAYTIGNPKNIEETFEFRLNELFDG